MGRVVIKFFFIRVICWLWVSCSVFLGFFYLDIWVEGEVFIRDNFVFIVEGEVVMYYFLVFA